MKWNWQLEDWKKFTYDINALEHYEKQFQLNLGKIIGSIKHVNEDEKNYLTVELLCTEAEESSEIEGEILNRDSLRSSISKNFGLQTEISYRVSPAEKGISEMMTDLYRNFQKNLSHEYLWNWHEMLMKNTLEEEFIGCYRRNERPMQIVSGPIDFYKIHFEAPPSRQIQEEMNQYIEWFNTSSNLPTLVRAGIAHWYFLCIHPFEDGNGRIARALIEKILAQSIRMPTLIAIAHTINQNKKKYYEMLAKHNKKNKITDLLVFFSEIILEAQEYTQKTIDFFIYKGKLFNSLQNELNERQIKVLNRIFKEGIEGFKGGLSAENYLKITNTSRATATRDLQDLVNKKALYKTGSGKGTRYFIYSTQT